MQRPSWSGYSVAYWICIAGAFALLIVDIVADTAWTNYGTILRSRLQS